MDTRAIRTIYAADLSTHKTIGLPYMPLKNSTLNQKFKIHEKEMPHQGEYPNLKYVAIGNKGARLDVSTDGELNINQIPHSPEHAALYRFMPFIIRPLNEDLSHEERTKYRCRVLASIGGVKYVLYYLMAIDTSGMIVKKELRHVENGAQTSNTFEPDEGVLSPEQIDISNIDLNNPNNDCLVAVARMHLVIDSAGCKEIINAHRILYGANSTPIISEVALCTAIDRTLPAPMGTATGNYIEAVTTQINVFLDHFERINDNKNRIELVFDVGSSELMTL